MFVKYNKTTAIGPYISCELNPHIQSFMIAVDKRALPLLKYAYRCPRVTDLTRRHWITDTEVRLGKMIVDAGFELRSLLVIGVIGNKRPVDKFICASFNPTWNYPISMNYKAQIFMNDKTADRFCFFLIYNT
jgi:hypothetical protein